jgi:hypothetical protein
MKKSTELYIAYERLYFSAEDESDRYAAEDKYQEYLQAIANEKTEKDESNDSEIK